MDDAAPVASAPDVPAAVPLTALPAAPPALPARVSTAPGFKAALLLFFLAPATAELLSGSTPPAEYFLPLSLAVQLLSYGALAVLLREFAVRRGLGWWARLPLALTMGMFIEGVLCKTFYSLHWADFSFPEGYGRLWGVNWHWAAGLLVYHSLMSCLVPWLVVELVYPPLKDQPALTRRSTLWLCAGALAAALFGNLAFPQTPNGHDIYHPGLLASLISWGGLLYIPWLAARYGPRLDALAPPAPALPPLLRPASLGWLCALAWLGFFAITMACATKDVARVPAQVPLLLTLLWATLALAVAHQMRGVFSVNHAAACLLGTGWFWFVFGILQELDNAHRPDNTSGMALVGAAGLIGAYWVRSLLKRRAAQPDAGLQTTQVPCVQPVDNPNVASGVSA